MPHSHPSQRVFKGEALGRPIADWLNRNRDTRAGSEVLEFVKDLRDLCTRKWDLPYPERAKEHFHRLSAFNAKLRQFNPYWPSVVAMASHPKMMKGRVAAPVEVTWVWSPGRYGAAADLKCRIIELSQQKLFHRLRQCQVCANWFYARSVIQEHCSNRCRERRPLTPEQKAAHTIYMRRLRKAEKERDMRALQNPLRD